MGTFLVLKLDDPITKSIVESETQPVAIKEAVLEAKLSELLKNPQFVEELKAQLATYAQHSLTAKNIMDGGAIDVVGSVHIGDKTGGDTTNYDQKNIVKGGTAIKAGGDF